MSIICYKWVLALNVPVVHVYRLSTSMNYINAGIVIEPHCSIVLVTEVWSFMNVCCKSIRFNHKCSMYMYLWCAWSLFQSFILLLNNVFGLRVSFPSSCNLQHTWTYNVSFFVVVAIWISFCCSHQGPHLIFSLVLCNHSDCFQ